MTRAFASWSAHHPSLNFHDVSNACSEHPLGDPQSLLYESNGDGLGRGCSLAEVFISAAGPTTQKSDVAASATTKRIRTSPSCCSAVDKSCCFRLTNGVVNDYRFPVYDVRLASVSFNSTLCWYLDSTFCSEFHKLKEWIGEDEAMLLGRVMLFAIFGLVALETMFTLYLLARRHCARPGHLDPGTSL